KAKQEEDFRFYALYDKIYRIDILEHAYRLVHANGGSPGIDGVSSRAIEDAGERDQFLTELAQQLESRSYTADAVKRVWIPKPDGSQRPLGIPTLRDRVAQMAVKLIIEPIFEADFCDTSYGFRPQKSAHEAVDSIADTLHQRYTHVIDADLSKYFDTIPHTKLMAVVAERIVDGAILDILQKWLKATVIEEDENGKRRTIGGGKGNRRGTPQGGVISPLLANLYLHLLDRIWERHNIERRYGARLVRFADDMVILCKGEISKPLALLTQILDRLGLTLNETKTHIVNAFQESFDFLGFSFRMRKSKKSGKWYPHTEPSRKSIQRIKEKAKSLTDRKLTLIPMDRLMCTLNRSVHGWCNYFHYRNSSTALGGVKWYIEERVRTHLMRRHKVRCRGTGFKRFSSKILYQQYGLYPVPTSAKWKHNAL
ncbi:MAG TPA: group II intron reverse transcriptase/maturase, partial [Gammaproteobacteria bacterium]|nr:group II intron reverse transcriptase/maturase [Gammaproteobacteria bacterium]